MSGDTALLTCVVSNPGDKTLLWKKVSKNRGGDILLTAGAEVVSSDPRLTVLHEAGGNVFVLRITNLTAHDSGWYLSLSMMMMMMIMMMMMMMIRFVLL